MCIFVIIMVSAAIIYKGRYANKAIVNQELDLRVILSYDVMIVFLCMVALLLKKHLQVINIAITGISIIYILSTLLNKKWTGNYIKVTLGGTVGEEYADHYGQGRIIIK